MGYSLPLYRRIQVEAVWLDEAMKQQSNVVSPASSAIIRLFQYV
jgi:hypothetical protein